MAQILIRELDDEVKLKLDQRARKHGQSTAAEVRDILANAVRDEPQPPGLGTQIAALFKDCGLGEGEEIPELRGFTDLRVAFEE